MQITACDRCGTELPSDYRTDRVVHKEENGERRIEVLLYAETRVFEKNLVQVRFSELCLDCLRTMIADAMQLIDAEIDARTA